MKVFRNNKEIARRDQLGRRFSFVGLIILFIGLIASFVPSFYPPGTTPESAMGQFIQANWATLSFGALPLGFIAASVGSYFVTRYSRRRWQGTKIFARPDEVLERSLKGFDDKYGLYVFALPVGYVLSTPFGLVTIALRSDKGRVNVNGDKWREGWGLSRLLTLFAREGIGHPPTELAEQARKMRAYFAKAPESETGGLNLAETPIEGVVLFLNPQTLLNAENPSVPVLRADQLKEYLRKRVREVKPNPALIRAANAWLETHNSGTAEVEA